MDPIACAVVAGTVYLGYRWYQQISPPVSVSVQPVALADRKFDPAYTFSLGDNVETITSNVLLANKPQLIEAIKYTHDNYGICTNTNSYLFYYCDVPLLKMVRDVEASHHIVTRIPAKLSNKEFTIVYDKNYSFEHRVPNTYEIRLTPTGGIDITKNPQLYNYPTIKHFCESGRSFIGVSEIIFTYYNIPLIKLTIIGQEQESRSLIMDLA